MESANINIITGSELKARAQAVFDDLGLDMSTAINVFLKQVVRRDAIPFEIARTPSSRKQARPGGWEGKVRMSDDFDAPTVESDPVS
jgi:DNA-damage-inducible protein J